MASKRHVNWKAAETRAAAFFGTKRRPGSGGFAHRGKAHAGDVPDEDGADDAVHPDLFIEAKRLGSSAVWTLYLKAQRQAHAEKRASTPRGPRVPVLCMTQPGQTGFLLVAHSDDAEAVLRAMLDAKAVTGLPESPKASGGLLPASNLPGVVVAEAPPGLPFVGKVLDKDGLVYGDNPLADCPKCYGGGLINTPGLDLGDGRKTCIFCGCPAGAAARRKFR